MADHYRLLGVTKSSSKEEIKEAFRKLAIQYHPDKHAQSSKSARDAATLKFKQVSEAYEVLVDDRKRAAYNLSRYNKNSSYSYHNNYDPNYYYRGGSYHRPPPFSSQPHRFMLNLDAFFRYMTTRAFLLNVAFAGYTPLSLSRAGLFSSRTYTCSYEQMCGKYTLTRGEGGGVPVFDVSRV